jgi:hypothetical protein
MVYKHSSRSCIRVEFVALLFYIIGKKLLKSQLKDTGRNLEIKLFNFNI